MARSPKFDDDEILDRAMTLLWSRGWARTSIRDLELALEIKAPSIYRRFGSKEALGAAAVDHYVDRIVRRRVARFLPGEGDPVANLRGFLESAVTEGGDGGRLWGCLLTTASMEADPDDALLAETLRRGLLVIEDGLRAEVERAVAADQLASGVDAEAAAQTLVLAMQGLMALSRSGGTSTDLRRRARAAVSVIAA